MAKRLVVCCDGTWNKPDQGGGPTNVTKMARAILPSWNGIVQQVYYDSGVGTGNAVDRFLGGTFGIGLGQNVQEAYRTLALNYEPGDSIMMFGFSRGAYTVRSLAGLVSLVGLVRKGDLHEMPKIWDYYRSKAEERQAAPLNPLWFKDRQPEIEVLGVWDTVGSLGIPGNFLGALGRRRHEFHDVKLGSKIRRAYHALAIDEHRKNFTPAIWDTSSRRPDQEVDQVWFCGAHSNVGGGYPDRTLSDQSFLWMCGKVMDVLGLDQAYLDEKVERLADDEARGLQMDSLTLKWKLLGRIDREIGQDESEAVHRSAFVRKHFGTLGRQPKPYDPYPYRSKPLESYVDRFRKAGREIRNYYPLDGA